MSSGTMPRRLLSLLAFLLLLLATQAVADGDGDGDEGGRKGDRDKDRHEDRDDDSDDDKEDKDDDEEDEDGEGRRGQKGGGEKEKDRKAGRAHEQASEHAGSAAEVAAPLDVGLTILPTALPGRAQFSFVVAASTSGETTLVAQLPQTGRPWTLSGPGAAACDVAGLRLACDFDRLVPGEVDLVQATSSLGRVPTWALTATGSVGAGDAGASDAVPRNDAAAASLGLFLR